MLHFIVIFRFKSILYQLICFYLSVCNVNFSVVSYFEISFCIGLVWCKHTFFPSFLCLFISLWSWRILKEGWVSTIILFNIYCCWFKLSTIHNFWHSSWLNGYLFLYSKYLHFDMDFICGEGIFGEECIKLVYLLYSIVSSIFLVIRFNVKWLLVIFHSLISLLKYFNFEGLYW